MSSNTIGSIYPCLVFIAFISGIFLTNIVTPLTSLTSIDIQDVGLIVLAVNLLSRYIPVLAPSI